MNSDFEQEAETLGIQLVEGPLAPLIDEIDLLLDPVEQDAYFARGQVGGELSHRVLGNLGNVLAWLRQGCYEHPKLMLDGILDTLPAWESRADQSRITSEQGRKPSEILTQMANEIDTFLENNPRALELERELAKLPKRSDRGR